MRKLLALVLMIPLAGCECGRDVSVGFDDPDAGAGTPDAGGYDAGDRFLVGDAGEVSPACGAVERIATELPDFGDYLPDVFADGDRMLVVFRDQSGLGVTFELSVGPVSGPVEEIATYADDARVLGFVESARFRDGAWDILISDYGIEGQGLVIWLRLFEDGTLEVTPRSSPRRFRFVETYPFGDGFAALVREDGLPGDPYRVLLVHEAAEPEILDVEVPPGADQRFSLLPRPTRNELLLVAHDILIGEQPRALRLRPDPLRIDGPWIETHDFDRSDYVQYRMHDTPAGLVSTTFRRTSLAAGGHGPRQLEVRWLDESLTTTALWSVETVVLGDVTVLGAPPNQDLIVTLPDSDDDGPHGTATIFHARASQPGTVSTLTPIGRCRAAFPPQSFVRPDGRRALLHFDERVDIEVLCAAP